jgi:hypothetical protein
LQRRQIVDPGELYYPSGHSDRHWLVEKVRRSGERQLRQAVGLSWHMRQEESQGRQECEV